MGGAGYVRLDVKTIGVANASNDHSQVPVL